MSQLELNTGRVTLFLPSLSAGGAERVMVFLANAFADRGYDVGLATADASGPRSKDVKEGVRLIDLKASRMAFAVLPLARLLNSERPEVLFSSLTHANVAAVAAARLARFRGRVVVSERNSLAHLRASAGAKGVLRSALARRAYASSDCIVAVSNRLKDELTDFLGSARVDVQAIYNPIDLDFITAAAREAPEIDLPGEARDRVVGIGRLTRQKGFDTLLRAFAQVGPANRHLIILGEGPERAALEQLAVRLGIDARVHMPGHVDNVFAVLQRSAVFVLSSRYEGMPNALLEAMACGCHVVSTDCPTGPNEILRSAKDGVLVPVDDADAMSRALEQALAATGRNDVTSALERFSPDAVVNQYLDALFRPAHADGLLPRAL